MEEHQITWPQIFDGRAPGTIGKQWNVWGWPTMYVIDAKGVIRARDPEEKELPALIERLMAENARGAGDPNKADRKE